MRFTITGRNIEVTQGLREAVEDTFGKNYPRRFDGTGLFETIFARIDRGWENASDAVWQAKDDKRIFPKK